jgi:DNA repair and recombination protein RAD54B
MLSSSSVARTPSCSTWKTAGARCAPYLAPTKALNARRMASGTLKANVCEGAEFEMGGKTLEVDRRMARDEYRSGACFGRAGTGFVAPVEPAPAKSNLLTKKYVPLTPMHLNPAPAGPTRFYPTTTAAALSSSTAAVPASVPAAGPESHWTANWRKPQNKKHKTWDGDGFVTLSGGTLTLISDTGKLCAPYASASLYR